MIGITLWETEHVMLVFKEAIFSGLPSVVATRPHFHEPCLIEGAAVNVDGVSIVGRPHGQSLVMLDGLLHVLGIVFVDVVVGSE